MGPREERLKTEIERARQELAESLSELKTEAAEARRRATKMAAIGAAAVAGMLVARFVWKRIRR